MNDISRVRFFDGTLETTRLGFGGNDLLGNKTEAQGLHLLETAFEYGVRHFDVAPAYGYGDAEKLVGQFAKGKRTEITLATKFGREAMLGGSQTAQHMIGWARQLMRASPFVRRLVKRNAHRALATGRFDVPSAARSLDNSLRLLGTDYIDLYLLHECQLGDCSPALLTFLNDARQKGKIRFFGIGTTLENASAISSQMPEFSSIVQLRAKLDGTSTHKTLLPRSLPERAILLHGAVAQVKSLRQQYCASPSFASEWDIKVQVDPHGPDAVGLALQLVFAAFPQGIVLFRSSSPERIKQNIHVTCTQAFSTAQLENFAAMARQHNAI